MAQPRAVLLLGASAVAAVALATAGCASGGGSTGGSSAHSSPSRPLPTSSSGPGSTTPSPGSATATTPATSPASEPPTAAGGPRTLSLSSADNGTSVRLKVGQRLHIALPTSYWTFHPSDAPAVLRQDATGVATPSTACPGPIGTTGGCGARTADYTAIGVGRAAVLATRVVCGEAMRCTGSRGRFTVYVAVAG